MAAALRRGGTSSLPRRGRRAAAAAARDGHERPRRALTLATRLRALRAFLTRRMETTAVQTRTSEPSGSIARMSPGRCPALRSGCRVKQHRCSSLCPLGTQSKQVTPHLLTLEGLSKQARKECPRSCKRALRASFRTRFFSVEASESESESNKQRGRSPGRKPRQQLSPVNHSAALATLAAPGTPRGAACLRRAEAVRQPHLNHVFLLAHAREYSSLTACVVETSASAVPRSARVAGRLKAAPTRRQLSSSRPLASQRTARAPTNAAAATDRSCAARLARRPAAASQPSATWCPVAARERRRC
eukprot:22707-Chlamydomonas_euryale.AAC.23